VAAYRQALQRFRALEDDAEAAATLLALSGLAAATHDYDEADRLARDALALHESGRGRADALGQLAGFLRLRGKEDEAVGMMKEAIAELERLPPDDEVRAQLAGRLGELGRWLMQARPDEARALFRRARPLWEDLVSRLKRPAQRWAFGAMHHPESWLAESPAEAVRICEEAVELLDELVREHPVIPRYRVTLSSLQNCLNIHLQRDDRPSEALVHIEQALANARELHARFPEVERGRYLVASYLGNLGNVQFDLGDRETARESFREATERMEALVRDTKSEASRESKPTYGMVHITRERPDYDLWLEVAHMREAQLWESFGDYARAIECESLKATPRLDLARLLLMCPDRSMRDPHRALAITRERGRLETEWYALAQLRLGRLDEARRAIVPALKRPARSPSQHAKALRWIVHALILHHSGDADGARTELARAREWIAEQRPFKGGYHRYRTGIVERFADDAAREMAEGTSQEK
jgi:tetratricopeptide (TPR) repeat protein